MAPPPEERRRALRYRGGPPESSRGREVEAGALVARAAQRLRTLSCDVHAVLQLELPHGSGKEGRPAAMCVEEEERGLVPKGRQHQSGNTRTRAEVHHRLGWHPRARRLDDRSERAGMVQVGPDRPGAEETEPAGFLEESV